MNLYQRVFAEADFGHANPEKQKAWSRIVLQHEKTMRANPPGSSEHTKAKKLQKSLLDRMERAKRHATGEAGPNDPID